MHAGPAGKEQELALASLKYARELLAEEAARLQNQLRAEVKKRVIEGLMMMLEEQVVIRQSTESLSARVAAKIASGRGVGDRALPLAKSR